MKADSTFANVAIWPLFCSTSMVLGTSIVWRRGLGRAVVSVMQVKHVTDVTKQPLLKSWLQRLIVSSKRRQSNLEITLVRNYKVKY